MDKYASIDGVTIYNGDCRDIVPCLSGVGAVVTDPPYGISFMGRGWDHQVPGVDFWRLFMDACVPGAHLAAFGGTRQYHRMACAIDDAGWEVRDCLMWLYGSGFPKSLDVSKAIDRAAGAEREVVGEKICPDGKPASARLSKRPIGDGALGVAGDKYGVYKNDPIKTIMKTAPATNDAKRWHGWGTALKPAWEPITLARKPLAGTVASNVLEHGTGAINVDGCRVGDEPSGWNGHAAGGNTWNEGNCGLRKDGPPTESRGRWPANLLLDGEAAAQLDKQQPGVSRFFYTAKASPSDRGNAEEKPMPLFGETEPEVRNTHPTVKPTDVMSWLVHLLAVPGRVVLDPFAGSGSTLLAAKRMGVEAVGCELSEEYCEIIAKRLGQACVSAN